MENIGDLLNDSERFKKPSSDSDNVNVRKIDDEYAEGRADYLVFKLQAPGSRKYFLKVSYKLPDGTVDRLIATAIEKGRSPLKLFIHLAEREMRRLNGRK